LYLDNKKLPDHRAELYYRIVDNLLYRRFQYDTNRGKRDCVENYLKFIAFRMREKDLTSIEVGEAKELLKQVVKSSPDNELLTGNAKTIDTLFEEIEPRCGVLKRSGEGDISFFHRTFQEFLAARHIMNTDTDFKKFLEKPWWEETILLYIGLVSREWQSKANQLIRQILTFPHKDPEVCQRLWLLAGKALRDIRAIKRDKEVKVLTREKLCALIDSNASLEQRFEAGEILGSLGAPRIDIESPLMVHVEAGEFTMGANEDDDEKPIHRVHLDEYMIGTYLVTNDEFRVFLEDGGYKNKGLWATEGWKFLQKEKISEPLYWHDRKWNGPNFPVVGVGWYEAAAYAEWLSEKTGETGGKKTKVQIAFGLTSEQAKAIISGAWSLETDLPYG
ncbi:MAG: SUMF1/EgtB/PvdO family nonheme iron enzyme, partial [bacterium]|nr:SUMF1/EgtB/PvdO family nonheme iron enzyme [bacterium]